MSLIEGAPRLFLSHGPKQTFADLEPNLGNLSPDVQPDTLPVSSLSSTASSSSSSPASPSSSPTSSPSSPVSSSSPCAEAGERCLRLGKFLLFPQGDKQKLTLYTAVDTTSFQQLTCKVFPLKTYRQAMSAYWQVDDCEHVAGCSELVLGATEAYAFFPETQGNLHSYVRLRKKLDEDEARRLFKQIVTAVSTCHDNGVILRDLKLRKFVFQDKERTHLLMESLEDALVLPDDAEDTLKDKHGCPAYVSPEILTASERGYSGRSADVWSLGVMLYTMLVGRYPFHDAQPMALFGKIRRGHFHLPSSLSFKAQCLIRSLLAPEPEDRPTASDILYHPWFQKLPSFHRPACPPSFPHGADMVPDMAMVPEAPAAPLSMPLNLPSFLSPMV